ncbi:uncharacterized protein BX663DRAFT_513037 [Cokeromyces recurvatus]|uniref:uncharacterized protein n=1 Tax=Cokeromyces recurvatus TaxID=90255 RepID=UPI00221EA265|nr:uncharacterized protein BX663DRAFT_513037 [Cokeromyces recurvatus]KAI7901954.1 hypothetical protein BX663DRAFT_513037 [Cokeromyces recurvatus]
MSSFETANNNLMTLNKEPFPTQQTSSSSSSNIVPDSKDISKLILRSALQRANMAVQCDSMNDVPGAIHAYKEAISLLERVLSSVKKESERQRLQTIHDSYLERIRLLSSVNNGLEQDSKSITSSIISNNLAIRRMASSSSMNKNGHDAFSNNISKVSVFHPQSSKSTPIRQLVKKKLNDTRDEEEEVEEEEEEDKNKVDYRSLEHQQSSVLLTGNPSLTTPLHPNRSSISSSDSCVFDSIIEQPTMTLPSLKKKEVEIVNDKNKTEVRTSSLPLKLTSPIMQRSSSMIAPEPVPSVSSPQEDSLLSTSPPHQLTRSVIARPSVGGSLGSMRRKAINRLSIEGFSMSRNKDKLSHSPGNHSHYGYFIKDQIKPVTTNDIDYLETTKRTLYDDNQEEKENDSPFVNNEFTNVDNNRFGLLFALEKSMLEGAYITQKLYIPKALWQQPNIRLSSVDIKVSACETLMNDIARLENWNYLNDLSSSIKLLEQFEHSIEQLQLILSKKLKRVSLSETNNNGTNHQQNSAMNNNSNRDSISVISRIDTGKKAQSFMSWGTKLTKSVERMNAFSLTKTEDQYKNYIEVLQKCYYHY